jgi:hypothetical protein
MMNCLRHCFFVSVFVWNSVVDFGTPSVLAEEFALNQLLAIGFSSANASWKLTPLNRPTPNLSFDKALNTSC